MEREENQFVPSILVVDDTPANLNLLCTMLKERGYRARPVPNGELALKAAAASPPDLVLLDIDMPGMTGYEVCEHLKVDPAVRDVPVIFISAFTDVAEKVKAFRAGGVDYVTKPFQFDEVHARVATHLELTRRRRELEESYARLEHLERSRDDLVHMIVHDMRSPLTALITSLTFLKEDVGAQVGEQALEDIDQALLTSGRLSRLANDMLDVSRFESGQMPMNRREHDLVEVARAAIGSVRGIAPEVLVRLDAPEPVPALCDGALVRRVVENIVGNGLKFTPRHEVLHVSIEPDEVGVRVSVRDYGPGVPVEHRARIFEKFGALRASDGQRYHSVGLGLAFCRLAVEAHGGRIGVDAADGPGSVFWFTLPRSEK